MKITKAELEAKETEIRNISSALSSAGLQIRDLQQQLTKAQEEAAKAKSERDSMKWSCDHNSERAKEATAELEQLHALLDAFPGCPSREVENDQKGRNDKPEKRTAMTRLASWLVARSVGVSVPPPPFVK